MLAMKDLYWIAGLTEGEGCFRLQTTKRYGGGDSGSSPLMAIQMNDLDVITRAHELLGASGSICKRERANNLATMPSYRTTIWGRRAAAWMMTLYPLMGRRRQKKILEVLTVWRSRRALARPTPLCGHPDRPNRGRRMCKNCYCMWTQGRLRMDLHPTLVGALELERPRGPCWRKLSA